MNGDIGDHRVAYEPRSETYHAQHDWTGDRRLSDTVIDVVAAVSGTPRDELDPFYWTLEANDLDTLYEPPESVDCGSGSKSDSESGPCPESDSGPGTETGTDAGYISFTYNDCAVAVFQDGHVIVNPLS